MPNELTIIEPRNLTQWEQAGQAANDAAARFSFADYLSRKATNTINRQRADLAVFAAFLATIGRAATGDGLQNEPENWRGITWGIVKGFVIWQLNNGYAVGTLNVRLSTVKTYAKLALQAGALTDTEYAMIRTVTGYSHKEAPHIDERRAADGLPQRTGNKKAQAVHIGDDQADALKRQPTNPQGLRDAALMCILLDHGLRVGEIARLTVDCVDLDAGNFRFHRPKVHKTQTHDLTPAALAALRAYLPLVPSGPLFVASVKAGDKLTTRAMTERGLNWRVSELGKAVGLDGLSPHDCRHYWATRAAKRSGLYALQQAGGWTSPAMPLRYIEASEIANKDIKL